MARPRTVGSFQTPAEHGKLGISTSDYKPVNGITGHESTDFTSEFLHRCHALSSVSVVGHRSFRDRGLPQTWCQNRQFADLLSLHGTAKVGGMIHHPKLGNDFAHQLSMTEKSHH